MGALAEGMHVPGSPAQGSLAHGFADPVLDSQRTFRAVMDALARPGTPQALAPDLHPPGPLTAELAAIALTLADADAPLWLDAALAADPAVAGYLRFHTGAPIAAEPAAAAFALVASPSACLPLEAFALGDQAYPDRSTTIVLAVETLAGPSSLRLRGPGIAAEALLAAAPLPPGLVAQWRANRALFPRGVDLLLAAPGRVLGLPRSTIIEET